MHHNMARKKVSAAGDKPRPFRCPAELPNKWRGGTATVPHSPDSPGRVYTFDEALASRREAPWTCRPKNMKTPRPAADGAAEGRRGGLQP